MAVQELLITLGGGLLFLIAGGFMLWAAKNKRDTFERAQEIASLNTIRSGEFATLQGTAQSAGTERVPTLQEDYDQPLAAFYKIERRDDGSDGDNWVTKDHGVITTDIELQTETGSVQVDLDELSPNDFYHVVLEEEIGDTSNLKPDIPQEHPADVINFEPFETGWRVEEAVIEHGDDVIAGGVYEDGELAVRERTQGSFIARMGHEKLKKLLGRTWKLWLVGGVVLSGGGLLWLVQGLL